MLSRLERKDFVIRILRAVSETSTHISRLIKMSYNSFCTLSFNDGNYDVYGTDFDMCF